MPLCFLDICLCLRTVIWGQAAVCSFQWEGFIWLVWLKPLRWQICLSDWEAWVASRSQKGVLVSFSLTDKQLICRSSAKQVSSSKRSQHWAMRGGLLSLTLFSLLSLEGKHGHQKHYLYHIFLVLGVISLEGKFNPFPSYNDLINGNTMYSHFSGTFENLPQSGGSFDFHYSGHSSKAKALTLAQRPKWKLGNTIQLRHIAQCMLDIVQYCMVLCDISWPWDTVEMILSNGVTLTLGWVKIWIKMGKSSKLWV